jgi:tetratricopeptide (TPR) repeat protein
LKEAGQFADARGILESVVKEFPDRPEAAEATLRIGQSLKDEALAKLAGPRQVLASPTAKPEEIAAALQFLEAETKNLATAVDYLEKQAEALKKKHAESEPRAHVLYEAAWGCRILAEIETAAARNKLVREGRKEGQPIPPLSEAAADRVPVPAAEKKVRELYQALIADFADLPLTNFARLELSEILAGRGEYDAAAKLIDQALDKEPPQDLTDKLRLQLGLCRAMKGDVKSALEQFASMEKNPKSPAFGLAHLWAGEALMRAGDWQGAVKHLAPFRDQQPLRNLPGITDRALLRLGQAHAQLKQWDQSRQAYERLVNEQGNSPLVAEARYGMGWAWQQHKDYENAVNAYLKAAESPTRTGARAQLQAGISRLEQKRYADAATMLKAVASRYAYPELSAAALLEAARAHADLKQKDEAEKLLDQVAREQPKGTWADAAAAHLMARL